MEKKAIKKLTELDEDLSSFNGVGDETDVKEIMHQIETVMSNAKTSEGKARFADYEGASQGSELAKLQDYNQDKKEEVMEKVEDAKESALKDLNKTSSKDVVNKAYQEFKDGDITYDQYTAILASVKNTSGNMNEKELKEESTESFIKYLEDRGMLNQYMEEHLDDRSNYYLKQAKEDYKNKDIDKATYESIRSGIIQDGTSFIKNAGEKKFSNTVSEQVEKDVGQWAKKYNPDAILKEQQAIAWNGLEKGGYESPNVWNKNIKINMYKNIQNNNITVDDMESKQKVEEAEKMKCG